MGATKRMVITEKALLIRLESDAYPSNLITSPFLKCSYRNEESQPGRFICVVSVQTYFIINNNFKSSNKMFLVSHIITNPISIQLKHLVLIFLHNIQLNIM